MLAEAKSKCDQLWVGLHTDPSKDRPEKNQPVQSMFERYYQLNSCEFVDSIIPYDTEYDLVQMMGILPIAKRFVGDDHRYDYITGAEVMEERGIEVVFTNRYHTYSSSELRERFSK
jgi:glycerol-3-phosphate cytidylyltransferase